MTPLLHQKKSPLLSPNSFSIFKSKFLKFIQPHAKSVFHIHNPKGIKLITQLHLGLSHLCKCKNLNTALKICSTPFACLAVVKLNPVLITYSTVPFFLNKKIILLNFISQMTLNILEHCLCIW